MDAEQAIEFILEQHVRTEAALARLAEREDRTAQRQEQTEGKLARTETLLRRAVRAGVEEARRQRVQLKALDEKMAELAVAQRETQASLKAFIDSMNRGGNGRH